MTLSRQRIIELDAQHVWHPYTPMDRHLDGGPALVVERAEGSRFFDVDGRSFIDGNSSWWVSLLGHNHPRLLEALAAQANRMCHVAMASIAHEPAAALAHELAAVAPAGLNRVFYSDDGSTAIEVAAKICLQYWQQNGRPKRRRFVSLSNAFHGETLTATAFGGVDVFRKPFLGVLLDGIHVNMDDRGVSELESLLGREADSIAGCVVEPMVQGAGGMRIYSAELLRRLREVTRKHDVFLVADEVFTGYGRTGPMWACDHAGVVPDLLCTAKGFTGGILPMAATLATERIFDGFRGADDRALYYGHTYCGHPLGAAVAREVLAIYADEAVLDRAAPKARKLSDALAVWSQRAEVTEERCLGMLAAFKVGSAKGYLGSAGRRVCEAALDRGAYLRPLGDVVYLAPPLNIPDEDLEELIAIVTESLDAARS